MTKNNNEGYVFGLDIGTRSIVGTVGYRIGTDRFIVVAQEAIEHTTRAVIDGQIHDISTVAKTITEIKNRLENRLHQNLMDVSIAAAGRVLKTKKVQAVCDFPGETKVTEEHIRSLDMLGVEKAYEEIRQEIAENEKKFFCVGYSTVKYFLNGYPMEMVEMHTANSIGVELIATFLPEEVVDGLYSAVEEAGLHVASLTLEPIAAIQVAIPEKFRLLNIALVDVGAGTSDISIVKEGSIIAFGMIPLAGDEVTEAIAQNYLVDFETAEWVKRQCERRKSLTFSNIFDENIRVTREEIAEVCADAIGEITKSIAERIIVLNGGKTVSAVFVVGGGGKHEGFTKALADYLELPENRVAIRGAEVLNNVEFEQPGIQKDSTLVTPIGICMNYYEQRSNFIHVTVNEQRVKLYDNGKVTVLDACISAGFSQTNLFPLRGESLYYSVNGESRETKGKSGEPAQIWKNGKEVSLNEEVVERDDIRVRPSTRGEQGRLTVGDIPECREEIEITLMGRKVLCPKLVMVNGITANPLYEVRQQDKIQVFDYYTVGGVFEFAEMEKEDVVLLNGKEAGDDDVVKEGDTIARRSKPGKKKPAKEKEPEESKPAKEKKPEESKPIEEKEPEESKPIEEKEPEESKQGGKKEPEKSKLIEKKKSERKKIVEIEEEEPEELGNPNEQMEKDPLLQPLKPLPKWMEGVPFDTAKLGADGKVIPGVRGGASAAGIKPSESQAEKPPEMPATPVHVTVNGTSVTMPAKAKPIFVDVFDVYPFDMSKVGGTRLVTRINGIDKDFTEPVYEGDEIDLYWEK